MDAYLSSSIAFRSPTKYSPALTFLSTSKSCSVAPPSPITRNLMEKLISIDFTNIFQIIARPFGTKNGICVMVPALMVVSIALSCLENPSYNLVYRILSADANAATVIFVTSDTYDR